MDLFWTLCLTVISSLVCWLIGECHHLRCLGSKMFIWWGWSSQTQEMSSNGLRLRSGMAGKQEWEDKVSLYSLFLLWASITCLKNRFAKGSNSGMYWSLTICTVLDSEDVKMCDLVPVLEQLIYIQAEGPMKSQQGTGKKGQAENTLQTQRKRQWILSAELE